MRKNNIVKRMNRNINRNINHNKKINKKGQVVVYDFIFGFMTFILIITIATLLWFRITARITQEIDLDAKMKVAHDLASIMVNTPGNPARWEFDPSYGISKNFTIGLASDSNIISEKKLSSFIAINQSEGYEILRKNILNLGKYNFYMQIRWRNGTISNVAGKNSLENISASVSRKVIINNEIKTFELTIY